VVIVSVESDTGFTFGPDAAWRREGMIRVRNDVRDFMALDTKEAWFGGKKRVSSDKWEEGNSWEPIDGSQNERDRDGMQMSMCTVGKSAVSQVLIT